MTIRSSHLLALLALAGCGVPGEGGSVATPVRYVQAPGSPFVVGPMPGAPVVGDMNGDGRPDIVVPCGHGRGSKPTSGAVAVLLNRGPDRFEHTAAREVAVGSPTPDLALGDIDGDGDLDAATAEHDTYLVTLLVNDGRGVWSGPGSPVKTSNGSSPHTHALAMADLNGDGHADVLTSNADDNAISVLLGDGRAGFKPAPGSPFATGRHPYDELAIADMNRDGHLDVVAPLLQDGKIAVLLGDGAGVLNSPGDLRVPVGARPGFVAVGDFNGDGIPDAAASHDDVGMIDILINDGSGRLKAADGSPVRLDFPAWGIAAADMDGDRKCDLVLGAAVGSVVAVLLGDGRAGFDPARGTRLKAGTSAGHLAVADLNGDGRMDVVASSYEDGKVYVFLGAQ